MNSIRSFEFKNDDFLWFALEDVLHNLELKESDLRELQEDEPEDFKTLLDGTRLIRESGFYYLLLFVAKTSEAEEFFNWVMGEVVPSIFTKGYYKKGEENELTDNKFFNINQND